MNIHAPTSYPSGSLGKSVNFKSLYDTSNLPYSATHTNCSKYLCYTYSKNYIYKPHSGRGAVGVSSAGSLASKRRV